jgi:uncharacterized protein
MRIAMTGASGFVGRTLLKMLQEAGHQVKTLGRKGADYEWDLMAGPPSHAALEDVEAIIHLAGEPIAQRWTDAAKKRIEQTRVIGTRHLVQGIAKMPVPPKVLVSSSGIGIYGDRGDERLLDAAKIGDTWLAKVAQAWEAEALAAQKLGVRVVCLRTAMVLGDGGALKKMLPPFQLGLGGPIAGGHHWMSWIHLEDLCLMAENALNNHRWQGAINACAPNPVTNATFTKELGHALHRPTIFPVPAFAVKLLFGEMSAVVLESQRAFPREALEAGFQFRFAEVGPALKEILQK